MDCFEAVVKGQVQGVGYRMFATREAMKLSLDGWVRNEPDGTVRVRARGSQEKLRDFLVKLRQGPPWGQVDAIDLNWRQDDPALGPFQIVY